MQQTRRRLLQTGGLAAAMLLAGCPGGATDSGDSSTPAGDGTPTETPTATPTATQDSGSDESAGDSAGPTETSLGGETAVAGTWNALRSRLWDAVALGRAGHTAAGAGVAQDVFADFEGMNGEYGAHEMLEATSKSAYEGFERALGELRTALEEGDVEGAAAAADEADTNLRTAQVGLTDEVTTNVMTLQMLGARAATTEVLAAVGAFDAASTEAEETLVSFEDALVHGALESADKEAYESFESALRTLQTEAENGNAGGVTNAARSVLEAAVAGSYALVSPGAVAGVAHLDTLRSRGRDAAALTTLGGPSTSLAHAATLNTYRARLADTPWLADAGAGEAASSVVGKVFAHFESADAHDPFEKAAGEAYEGFESGLESLRSALTEGGDASGTLATVDKNLRSGIEALATGPQAATLQSGFFRARLADAHEQYRRGRGESAAAVVEDLFARFEQNELGFHEALEDTSESLYRTFEEKHLTALPGAMRSGDDGAVDTHYRGAQDALLSFESEHSAAVASSAETAFFVGRAFDAATLATLGARERAAAVVGDAFGRFEAGAAGFHEALEAADHELYESFESTLGSVRSAASGGNDVGKAARSFNERAIAAAYAVIGAGGGTHREDASALAGDVFATFEKATVHETLEEADHDAYETFEARLSELQSTISDGGNVGSATDGFADASTRAAFAVAGALEDAPVDAGGGGGGESATDLKGGPNVVEGVPDDADHVVKMQAVAFEPASLTVSAGDTVAFEHAAGEAHSVTAYGKKIPDGSEYWASGGFESEDAARKGWENGTGAVQSGQSYVHTFETPGTHEYFCIPHEAAGMKGEVVVEE